MNDENNIIESAEWIKPGIIFRVKYNGWKKRYYYFKLNEDAKCCNDLVCPFYRNCMSLKIGGIKKIFSELCNTLGRDEKVIKLIKDYNDMLSYNYFRPMTQKERDSLF